MPPEALLLDLGNVCVRLRSGHFLGRLGAACSPPRGAEQLRELLRDPALGHPDYERGRLDGPGFHARLREGLGLRAGYAEWLGLWNDYFEPNRPMEALLARLRPRPRLWALSNTNPEHLGHLKLNYRLLDGFEGFSASHLVGAAKPEPAIFRHALGGLGLDPGRVLYLDDMPEYVQAGRELGLGVFHYTFNDAELKAVLRELGFQLAPPDGRSAMAC